MGNDRLRITRSCGPAIRLGACLLAALTPCPALAQAGPPYLTNDPGTPGNGHWEINLASMQTVTRGQAAYQLPQIDLNYGLGERLQLTYEVPFVVQTDGHRSEGGWSNGYPGLKWRFLDDGADGWQVSTFPQFETGAAVRAVQRGIAEPGQRFLLPFEAAHALGPVDLDVEIGYYFPRHGVSEKIAGFVIGHAFTERLELDAELYSDRATPRPPRQTTLDFGGRFKVSPGFIALFMAGRTLGSTAGGQPEFMGYVGIQILLSDYGRALATAPLARSAQAEVPQEMMLPD